MNLVLIDFTCVVIVLIIGAVNSFDDVGAIWSKNLKDNYSKNRENNYSNCRENSYSNFSENNYSNCFALAHSLSHRLYLPLGNQNNTTKIGN